MRVALLPLILALGPARAGAGTTNTNYWVQPVTLTLNAYVQVGPNVLDGVLPTKQFLAFLSGLTNSEIVTGTNYTTTATVTNSPFLPTNSFPATVSLTDDYVVTYAGFSFTNNVSFTNPVVLTRTGAANPSYTFSNAVPLAAGVTAYLFPSAPAAQLTATLVTTNGPGTVFSLSGTLAAGEPVYGTNPNFAALSGAKLLLKTPLVVSMTSSNTNITFLSAIFVVRTGSGTKLVDTPVNTFFHLGSTYISVTQSVGNLTTGRLAFDEVDFTTLQGTSFNMIGFDEQTIGHVTLKSKMVVTGVVTQRKMTVSNYQGQLTGKIADATFQGDTAVVNGTIIFGQGTAE